MNKGIGLSARYQPMPQTVEEWRYLSSRYESVMLRDKDVISSLKSKVNRLERKINKLNAER